MRWISTLLTFVLIGMLVFTTYLLWTNSPITDINYVGKKADIPENMPTISNQFYPNMRYRDRVITYSVSDSCSIIKKESIAQAFSIISEKTILTFVNKENGEISITCSSAAPAPEYAGHFVAGEGGPMEIINATKYAVILTGQISFYRAERCDVPKIAIHEILHALGFDHEKNEKSIMYPVTSCDQEIDQDIIDEINRLYEDPALPDLEMIEANATKNGFYLSFDVTAQNIGLKDSTGAKLMVYADNEEVKEFDLGDMKIGTKRTLHVQNVKLVGNPSQIAFYASSPENEISKENNKIILNVASGAQG